MDGTTEESSMSLLIYCAQNGVFGRPQTKQGRRILTVWPHFEVFYKTGNFRGQR
jgi:hypothetical protein